MWPPFPLVDPDEDERKLSPEEVEQLDCRNAERRKQAQSEGAAVESEAASHSPRYGYIFRYHVPRSVPDEDGNNYDVSFMMIWRTTDCKMYAVSKIPYFELIPPTAS